MAIKIKFILFTYFFFLPLNNATKDDFQHPEEQADIMAPRRSPDYHDSYRHDPSKKYGTKTYFTKSGHSAKYNDPKLLSSPNVPPEYLPSHKKGCDNPPLAMNTLVKCTFNVGCRATCMQGYNFPNKQTSLLINCVDGEWEIQGFEWDTLPACEPICLPVCQNNGICVAPDQCNCPENFNGPQCQYEKKPCLNNPPLPKNSRRSCTSTSCTINCAKGHQFPDGTSIANLICKEGNWVPSKLTTATIPDCLPTCEPTCLNGGVCLALNTCQCANNYRGSQCQYSIDICDVKKMGFNGGYNCSGNSDGVSCSLSCPPGIYFSSPPVQMYTCLYSVGIYGPQPIPQCLYGNDKVITSGGSSHSRYKSHKNLSNKEDDFEPHVVKSGGIYGAHNYYTKNDSNLNNAIPSSYGVKGLKYYNVETIKPKPGICFTWNAAHFKTFDGKIYSFHSACPHILVRDAVNNIFNVIIQNIESGLRLSVFLEEKEYTLEASGNGGVIFKSPKRMLPIPAQLPGFRVEMVGHLVQITLEAVGVKIKWDTLQFVQIDVTESMWNKTEGLCGRIDGKQENDMITKEGTIPMSTATFFESWQIKKIGSSNCENNILEQNTCNSQDTYVQIEAEKFCNYLISHKKFTACNKIMDITLLYESCKWDYCGCIRKSRESCACDSLAVYVKQCVSQGVMSLINWRNEDMCPMECSGGMIYQACGPSTQVSCGSAASTLDQSLVKTVCTEGCYCPSGALFHKGECVTKDQCPCRLRGKQFPPGSTTTKECNTCTCQNGEWVCTQVQCGARCSAIGDPHYQTFDGKHYSFMGKCSYTLLKTANLSIEGENVACSGAISEAMGLDMSKNLGEAPSCTKAVTISFKNLKIELKQGNLIFINGKSIEKFPVKILGVKIHIVSSLFIKVEIPYKIELWWDGATRVYIDAPPALQRSTKGLCGTFNLNQKDDFLTPEGDVEDMVIPFANKWKTQEKCDDLPEKMEVHPCDLNIHNKATAEDLCGKLKSDLFAECHWSVDVESFYENCLYDMCSCKGSVSRCLCPILGAYATECARQGVEIQWRYNVKECEIHCTGGQIYQVCGDSCKRSCYDISGVYEDSLDLSEEAHCRSQCVEGCNCPEGQTLNLDGECIPIGNCPCRYGGLEFPARYKEVRPGLKELDLCTCIGAKWECQPASKEDVVKYPRALDIKDKCSMINHEEFTTCEDEEPLTCKNMHQIHGQTSPLECHPGCKCMKGYVLDSVTKKCIKPEDCPCHHGGKSYSDGEQMQEDCNKCECQRGKWKCEKRVCAGVCSSWGDSHFRTFDGRRYDFQGVCTYLLAKGSVDAQNDSFSIEMQNEVCGSLGVTCSKSVTLKVGSFPSIEIVTFTKNKLLPDSSKFQRIKIRKAGLFVFAEVQTIGLILQWDKGTRIYVKINPTWKGRLSGLCGNYNDNEADDFQTPSGGLTEVSPHLFGDSWKLEHHCPPSHDTQDTCKAHPERKVWATQKCGILKQYPFSACHSVVSPEEFLYRCEKDTCACSMGGDCECLCTALAAYVHECAAKGIPIKWRSQELCPMQCDETCTNYSPCISTCPVETCDNTLDYAQLVTMCPQDTCIEGCERKKICSNGQIYSNRTLEECVPRSICKPICMTLPNKRVILEGEIMEQDECHTCRCSRGKKICIGQPCATKPPRIVGSGLMEQKTLCRTGWSEWINNVHPDFKDMEVKSTKNMRPYSVEMENIPSLLQLNEMNGAYCSHDKITDIQCRTVVGHKSAKETELEAECSIENGLLCRQPKSKPCPDFEIRIKCSCENKTKEAIGEECSILNPISVHPSDCLKYLECISFDNSLKFIEKRCERGTLFNPKTLQCDWSQKVIQLKPECEVFSTTEEDFFTVGMEINPEESEETEMTTILPEIKCDPAHPNHEHPKDCAMFYQCATGMGPPEHPDVVLKTCGPYMMYNPHSMNCDWPQNVYIIKPACKGEELKVHPTVESAITFVGEKASTPAICEAGQIWSDCAVNCKKVCLYYDFVLKQKEKCQNREDCIPGCIDQTIAYKKCEKNFLWRDAKTCVSVRDCTCRSHEGKPVKPGEVYKESPCEICQCLENQYVCDKSTCMKSSQLGSIYKGSSTKIPVVFYAESSSEEDEDEARSLFKGIPSWVSPPPECDPNHYKSIFMDETMLGDDAFSASSSMGHKFGPQNAILNQKDKSDRYWSSEYLGRNEYIQVKLKRKEPIYGIWMQGSPSSDRYVTSYKVLTSRDGHNFDYLKKPDGEAQMFRGPIDNQHPMKQMFDTPIEVQYLRIQPYTWHNSISLRFDLIGCGEVVSTTELPQTTLTTIEPLRLGAMLRTQKFCRDSMGIENGSLPFDLISVSSHMKNNPVEYLNISQPKAWQPLTNSPEEWIMFNFTEPRKLVGIETKGGPNGWVTAFTVKYSNDGTTWNSIVNEEKEDIVFPANFDENSQIRNLFRRVINAQYLKIIPTKWKHNIQMRVEPIGCYKPYKISEYIRTTSVAPEVKLSKCKLCKGIDMPSHGCNCNASSAFNGHECVPDVECPCVAGHTSYDVGATYKTEDCQICTCKLGGVPFCFKKVCPLCKVGLIISTTSDCECNCVACPLGHRPCQTSQTCIPENSWCDGIEDCPDDEVDCPLYVETSTAVAEAKEKECPTPSCPTGYKILLKKTTDQTERLTEGEVAKDSLLAQPIKSARKSYMRYYKGGTKTTKGTFTKGGIKSSNQEDISNLPRDTLEKPQKAAIEKPVTCVQWKCISSRPLPGFKKSLGHRPALPPCSAPKCPPGYTIQLDTDRFDNEDCPKYNCMPPVPRDAVCNVTGRTFNTFDETEYQYDICDHILARDIANGMWDVTIQKNCTKHACVHEVLISQGPDQVRLRPDLSVEYNGYFYTVDQTKKIGFQTQTFAMSRLGETLFYVSTEYGFWVIYDSKGNIRLGVAGKLHGLVDGLCGYFNGKMEDDKRKPDGSKSFSTEEFGNSWAHKNSSLHCEIYTCPIHLQNEAWELCKIISHKTFKPCASALDIERNQVRCLEDVCACLQADAKEETFVKSDIKRTKKQTCLCNALQTFVTDCLAADQGITLQEWRTTTNCPAICPAPLVHYDCFRRSCELCCETLQEEKACSITPGVCFSGCFCPEGFIRKGENCILPAECRDCVCDSFGKPQYVTFDRQNYTFDGKCAYIAAREKIIDNKSGFQVYVNHDQCLNDPNLICTNAIEIVYGEHKLLIKKIFNELNLLIGKNKIINYPFTNDWIYIQEISGKDINLLIPDIQLEMTVLFNSMSFTLKLPSALHGNKTEGLCGNCDGRKFEDLDNPSDVIKYAKKWRAPIDVMKNFHLEENSCIEKPKNACWPLSPEKDPCLKIMNEHKFGKCHLIIDPAPYVASCQQDLCLSPENTNICITLEAYARECNRAGICLDWRDLDFCPYHCENGLNYKACGLGCQLTCENYEKYTSQPASCRISPTEGCFCPIGQLPIKGKCVKHSTCFPCDKDGHYAGDKWKKDECTECKCSNRGEITCIKEQCVDTISCTSDFEPKRLNKPKDKCCHEFICVPKPTEPPPMCDDPVKISCGYGQITKLETPRNKCPRYICQCMPPEECDPINMADDIEFIEPGMEKIINSSGCCPQISHICKPETCPEKPKCLPFYQIKTIKKRGDCCSKYICEPPADKCVYDMEYDSALSGGEIKRKPEKIKTVAKDFESTWQDGPCRMCNCKKIGSKNETRLQAACSLTKCPIIPTSEDFVIESVGFPDICCPQIKYTACKHDEKIHKIDEAWESNTNSCISYKCIQKDDGTLQKITSIKECSKNCKQGWKYIPSLNRKKTCCGECIQMNCVVNEIEYPINKTWTSKDHCTKYMCIEKNTNIQVQSENVSCPVLPEHVKHEYEIEQIAEEGKCCKKIKYVACKVKGKIYAEGITWKSHNDPCKNYTCIRNKNGGLDKAESIETCNTDCAKGWEYKESGDPTVCCGQCVQTACIVDDYIYNSGEIWYSSDNCTQFNCNKLSDQLVVTANQESCPDISECDEENIYIKGCCKHCNQTASAQVTCYTRDLPLVETIGLVQQRKVHPYGLCINKKPIIGFKQCKGSCISGTVYNQESADQDSDCKCCQASKFGRIIVDVVCENGLVTKKSVAIPETCECLACISESFQKNIKTARKTPVKYSPRSAFSPEGDLNNGDVEVFNPNEKF